MWLILMGVFKALAAPAKFVFKEIVAWADRRADIKAAKQDAKIAKIHAEAELAAYKMKTDLEWDLAWAGQAPTTWKDEYILVLWSVPILVSFGVFLPGDLGTAWMEHIGGVVASIQKLWPDAFGWWAGGWTLIFAAVYGNKAAAQVMMGSRVSQIAAAFEALPDDVPKEAVDKATQGIKERLQKAYEDRKAARAKANP